MSEYAQNCLFTHRIAHLCTELPVYVQICSFAHRFAYLRIDLLVYAQICLLMHRFVCLCTNLFIYVQFCPDLLKIEHRLSLFKYSPCLKSWSRSEIFKQFTIALSQSV